MSHKLDSILAGLGQLHEFIRQNHPRFQINLVNSPNRREFEKLRWLSESLQNYARRGAGLLFVGFLGHYSSGKSSTVNSLLGAGVQETDQHPTDQGVTLLTHPDNQKLVGPFERGGFAVGALKVPIQAKYHPADWLHRVVLMDTPGSGDVPGVVDAGLLDEVVREFLPLCDVIVYCFNGAVPLDNADLPLLEKKQRELPAVPAIFVVSRADEWQKDSSRLFGPDNFDADKAERVRRTLQFRIEAALAKATSDGLAARAAVADTPVLFVNNRGVLFGIDELRRLLLAQAEAQGSDGQTLHRHKLAYFAQRARERWEVFRRWTEERAGAAGDLHRTVQENYERFQLNLRPVVHTLEERWKGYHARIAEQQKQLTAGLAAKKDYALQEVALPADDRDGRVADFTRLASTAAKGLASAASASVAEAFRRRFRDRLREAAAQLDAARPTAVVTPLSAEEVLRVLQAVILPAIHLWADDALATALDRYTEELATGCVRQAQEHRARVQKLLEIVRAGAAQKVDVIFRDAIEYVRKQIMEEGYFSIIQSYQAAVTGANAYTAFATMPDIAAKLQAAHRAPDEAERQRHAEAVTERFLTAEDFAAVEAFRARFDQLEIELLAALDRAPQAPDVPALAGALRRTLEDNDPTPGLAAVAERLARHHAEEVAHYLVDAREQVSAYLNEVRQKADAAHRVLQEAVRAATESSRREAEARQEADEARRQHDDAVVQARLAKTTAEDTSAKVSQLRAQQVALRWGTWLTAAVLLILFGGYLMAAWLGLVAKPGEAVVQVLVGLAPSGLTLLLGGVGAAYFRQRLVRAEDRADAAETAHRKALEAAELANGVAVRAAQRAAVAEQAASAARQSANEHAEELRRLMLLQGDALHLYAAPVIRDCGRILQEAFTPYLDSDCSVEKELSEQFVRELNRQVQVFRGSEVMAGCVSFATRLRECADEAARLREEVVGTLRELTKKANGGLVLEGDKAPSAVFAEVQMQVIQPSLRLVGDYRDEWQRLKDELAALAAQYAPAD